MTAEMSYTTSRPPEGVPRRSCEITAGNSRQQAGGADAGPRTRACQGAASVITKVLLATFRAASVTAKMFHTTSCFCFGGSASSILRFQDRHCATARQQC